MFLFGPLAGVFVDRWDKRTTMLVMDAIRALLVAVLILAANAVPLPFFDGGHVPLEGQLIAIYAIVFLNSGFAQFFSPAKMALIGDIVPGEQLPRAGGLAQVTQSIAMLLAPPIAPILALSFGVEWALLIDALTFVFSFLMVLAIHAPESARSVASGQQGNVRKEFFQGLSFAVRNKFISTLIVVACVIMFGAAAINSLDIFFVLQNLHAPVKLYGLLSTAMGVGLIGGAVLVTTLAQRIGLVRTLNLSLLGVSAAIFAYARMTTFTPAALITDRGGGLPGRINAVLGPILLRVTPRELVGRVSGIINPATAVAQMLGTILSGYLASDVLANFHASLLGMQFGQIDTILTGGAVIGIFGTLFSIFRLGFRDPQPRTSPTAPVAQVALPEAVTIAE